MRVIDLMPQRSTMKLFNRVALHQESGHREMSSCGRMDRHLSLLSPGPPSKSEAAFRAWIGPGHHRTQTCRRSVAGRARNGFTACSRCTTAVMLLIDPVSGKINDANPASEKFYGYSVNSLTGNVYPGYQYDVRPEKLPAERSHALTSERSSLIFVIASRTGRCVSWRCILRQLFWTVNKALVFNYP